MLHFWQAYGFPSPSKPSPIPMGANGPVPGARIAVPVGYTPIYVGTEYVKVHVVKDGFDTTKPDSEVQNNLRFDALYVPLFITGKAFIENVGGGESHEIVEIYEKGAGKWIKGLSVKHGAKEANKTLREYGWERGKSTPVWVVLKKA